MYLIRTNIFSSPLWLVFALLLLLVAFIKPRITFAVMALIGGMILALVRTSSVFYDEDYVRQFYGQTIEVTGVVDGDPDTEEGTTKLKLSNLSFDEKSKKGTIFASLKTKLKIRRGDTITLKGKLSEGFGVFVGSLYRPLVTEWKQANPGDLALKIRDWFAERVTTSISSPESGLALSYLLGIRTGLPGDLEENLRTAGLVHIVVTSGTHLAILVGLTRKIFDKISRFSGTLVSAIFVIVFMAIVGFTPSITRAGLMTLLSLIVRFFGRKFSPWRIIIIAAATTLFLKPTYLIDLGWLLSFTSYAGVTILAPRFQNFLFGKEEPGLIGQNLIISISATLMTLPIILFCYGQISLLFLVTNLIITPTLPYVMGAVFTSSALLGVPLLGDLAALMATKMLDFHIVSVEWFGKMRQFLIEIPKEQWQVFLLYGLIMLFLFVSQMKSLWHNKNHE